MPDDTDGFISVSEAAGRLGVSERTVRRRIKDGELQAISVQTPQGHIWRIDPASLLDRPALPPGTLDRHPANATRHGGQDDDAARQDPASTRQDEDATRQPSDTPGGAPDMPPGTAATPEVLELVRLVDRLQQSTQQLAGQVGFLQAKLQDAQEENQQLRLLMAPKDEPAPADMTPTTSEPARPRRPWWKWWQ